MKRNDIYINQILFILLKMSSVFTLPYRFFSFQFTEAEQKDILSIPFNN